VISPFAVNKILYHPERIYQFLQTGETKPITWELDLTNLCNHNCPDCAGGRINKKSLDLNTGGGEPLLNPVCPQIIEYIKSKKLDVALITNGSLINKENANIILKNCTWVRISLDAGSPEIFKRTHGCNQKMFFQVLQGIKLLSDTKRAKNYKCTVGVAFLTSKETKNDMIKFTRLCRNLKVDYVQFRPYHYDKTNIDKELAECKREEIYGIRVLWSINKYQHLTKPRPYPTCYGHHFAGVINIHKLYLCCHFRGKERYELGDLRKNTLEEIWNSERRKYVYTNIDYSDCPPVCRCDTFNRFLWQLKDRVPEHINFL